MLWFKIPALTAVYSLQQILTSTISLEEKEKLKGRGEAGQHSARISLTQQFIPVFSYLQLNKCNFSIHMYI